MEKKKKRILIIGAVAILLVAVAVFLIYRSATKDQRYIKNEIEAYRSGESELIWLHTSDPSIYEKPAVINVLTEEFTEMFDNGEYDLLNEVLDELESGRIRNEEILDIVSRLYAEVDDLDKALEIKDNLKSLEYYNSNFNLNQNSEPIASYIETNGTIEITTTPGTGYYADEENESSGKKIGISGSALNENESVTYKGDFKIERSFGTRLNSYYEETDYDHSNYYFCDIYISFSPDDGECVYSGDYLFCFDNSGDLIGFEKIGTEIGAEKEAEAIAEADALTEQYALAEAYLEEGDIAEAAITFGKISEYEDSRERSIELWNTLDITTIACGSKHTVAVKEDGTVVATGDNENGQCNVSDWTDIVSVACYSNLTMGLRIDGTVVTTGAIIHSNTAYTLEAVDAYEDVISIGCGDMVIGCMSLDGYYISANDATTEITNDWQDLQSIVCGHNYITGLCPDGTVVTTGDLDVSDWTDIVFVTCEISGIYGITSDGNVVAEVRSSSGRDIDVSDWTDMVFIDTDNTCAVGVQSDGEVRLSGTQIEQCDVSEWQNIVMAVCDMPKDSPFIIGLQSDGTLIATGDNTYGQCDVSEWRNIRVPD